VSSKLSTLVTVRIHFDFLFLSSYLQLAVSGVLGTLAGNDAVSWASSNGWPLTWYQGSANDMKMFFNEAAPAVDLTSTDLHNLFLDPHSARSTTNISISDEELKESQESFDKQWYYFQELSLEAIPKNSTYWYKIWTDLWTSMSPSLRLKYADFTSCGDLENCFAVQISTGNCVCRTT